MSHGHVEHEDPHRQKTPLTVPSELTDLETLGYPLGIKTSNKAEGPKPRHEGSRGFQQDGDFDWTQPVSPQVVSLENAARRTAQRINDDNSILRGLAQQSGGLNPNEENVLKQVETLKNNALLHYLQQLDQAKENLRLAEENVRFSNSSIGWFDRNKAEARDRREHAEASLKKAKNIYQDLLEAASSSKGKQSNQFAFKAWKIHQARNQFAKLEAQLAGVHVSAEVADSSAHHNEDAQHSEHHDHHQQGAKHPDKPLSRHDELRQNFIKAKEEYVRLRAELLGAYLTAYLYEQSALADQRAYEMIEEDRGEGRKGLSVLGQSGPSGEGVIGFLQGAMQGAFDTVQLTAAKARAALYRWGQRMRSIQWGSATLEERVTFSMLGTAKEIAKPLPQVLDAEAPAALTRRVSVAEALRSPNPLKDISFEQLKDSSDAELRQFMRAVKARALTRGVPLSRIPGIENLFKAIGFKNQQRFERITRAAADNAEFDLQTRKRKVTAELRNILAADLTQNEELFNRAIQSNLVPLIFDPDENTNKTSSGSHRGPGITIVAAAFASFFGSASLVPEAHAQESVSSTTEATVTTEAEPQVETMTAQQAQALFVKWESDYNTNALYTAKYKKEHPLANFLGFTFQEYLRTKVESTGLFTLNISQLQIKVAEVVDGGKIFFYPAENADPINLGTLVQPNQSNYEIAANALKTAADSYIAAKNTEAQAQQIKETKERAEDEAKNTPLPWHRLPDANGFRTEPTGLFADECEKAAKHVNDVPWTQRIVDLDDGLDRLLDAGGHRLGLPDDPAYNLTPEDATTPMDRENAAVVGRAAKARLEQDAAAQNAIWVASGVDAAARLVGQEDLKDGRLQLPNGIIIEFTKQSEGYEINLPYVTPWEVAEAVLLRDDWQEIVSKSINTVNPGRYDTEHATTAVKYYTVRLASLLEVRDYMRDHGLSGTPEFEALKDEMDIIVDKISRFGHIIYDDPYVGNLTDHWEIEKYSDWHTPRIIVNRTYRAPNPDYNTLKATKNIPPEPLETPGPK